MDEILKLAKESGAYRYPDRVTVFPDGTLDKFYRHAFNAGLEAAVESINDVRADDAETETP